MKKTGWGAIGIAAYVLVRFAAVAMKHPDFSLIPPSPLIFQFPRGMKHRDKSRQRQCQFLMLQVDSILPNPTFRDKRVLRRLKECSEGMLPKVFLVLMPY